MKLLVRALQIYLYIRKKEREHQSMLGGVAPSQSTTHPGHFVCKTSSIGHKYDEEEEEEDESEEGWPIESSEDLFLSRKGVKRALRTAFSKPLK